MDGGRSKSLGSSLGKSRSSSPHRVHPLPPPLMGHASRVDKDEEAVSVAVVIVDGGVVTPEARIVLFLNDAEVLTVRLDVCKEAELSLLLVFCVPSDPLREEIWDFEDVGSGV
jgi:hypothetical protein